MYIIYIYIYIYIYMYIYVYYICIYIFFVFKKTFYHIDFFYIVLDFALLLLQNAEVVAGRCS